MATPAGLDSASLLRPQGAFEASEQGGSTSSRWLTWYSTCRSEMTGSEMPEASEHGDGTSSGWLIWCSTCRSEPEMPEQSELGGGTSSWRLTWYFTCTSERPATSSAGSS